MGYAPSLWPHRARSPPRPSWPSSSSSSASPSNASITRSSSGIMIATVALNAYLLDVYPEGSGEVDAWIVVGRTMGGFMATYVEINWVAQVGPIKALGAQAGITAAAGFLVLVLGLFGKRMRRAQGRMSFAIESGY